jgi:hypothetical protein
MFPKLIGLFYLFFSSSWIKRNTNIQAGESSINLLILIVSIHFICLYFFFFFVGMCYWQLDFNPYIYTGCGTFPILFIRFFILRRYGKHGEKLPHSLFEGRVVSRRKVMLGFWSVVLATVLLSVVFIMMTKNLADCW